MQILSYSTTSTMRAQSWRRTWPGPQQHPVGFLELGQDGGIFGRRLHLPPSRPVRASLASSMRQRLHKSVHQVEHNVQLHRRSNSLATEFRASSGASRGTASANTTCGRRLTFLVGDAAAPLTSQALVQPPVKSTTGSQITSN
jgi:hypothetical protein